MNEDEEQLKRIDSVMSPSFAESTSQPVFPTCDDDHIHVPPKDKPLFSLPPRLGKYVEFIRDLMTGQENASYFTSVFAADLCTDGGAILRQEKCLLEVDILDKVVVVGDIHGQFADLVAHVFAQQYDRPEGEADRQFLFLGDFVDRGPQGVEVLMLLLALKIEWPDNICLLRGNHEEAQTSRIYGFLHEVRTKFNDIAVWARFNEVFCFVPLAAVVCGENSQKFLALHGGLSPNLHDLAAISAIERGDYGGTLDTSSSDIVDGILWSDPTDAAPRYSRNERGCGYTFGAAATTDFCANNQLSFLCRAHQMTMAGYCWTHDGKCVTVFSAPNYCGLSNNLGAIMVVDRRWNIKFIQYQATASAAPSTRPLPQYFC